jgi:hypothetical protein
MESGSTLTIDFDRTLYPLWEMTANLQCTITTPASINGNCIHLENGFKITVNQEYNFNTNYVIAVSGLAQAVTGSTPSFIFSTKTKLGAAIGQVSTTGFTTTTGGTSTCTILELQSVFATPNVWNYL